MAEINFVTDLGELAADPRQTHDFCKLPAGSFGAHACRGLAQHYHDCIDLLIEDADVVWLRCHIPRGALTTYSQMNMKVLP